MRQCRTGLAAITLALGVGLAALPVSAQTLTIGLSAAPNSADPHFFNGTSAKTISEEIFDHLFTLSPDIKLEPGLAVSWKLLSDTVWEIKLRPGVRFTDGHELSADDVAFTFQRAANVPRSTGGFAGLLRAIESTEVEDPLTLRIHTKGPAPNLALDLASVVIISRYAGEGATTEDYNSGKATIGTGAYKMVSYVPGDRVELERNDAWWGPKQDWQHVTLKFLPNASARSAAVLSGAVDLIDTPSPNDLPRFRTDPNLSVFSHPGTRLIYIAPNQGSDAPSPYITDKNGKPLPHNPLRDAKVRRALSIAINRVGLAERVLENTASPAGQWLPPGAYSYNPDVKVPATDPAAARVLLAQAGYPEGFRITLHVSADSRPTDPVAAQAIAQMWTRIGVQTSVEAIPLSAYAARSRNGEFALTIWGWGSVGEAGYALVNVMNTVDAAKGTGSFNRSNYTNPALDALTDRALTTMDDTKRERLLMDAVAMAMNDEAIIPLYQMTNFWVARKGITYQPSGYDQTLATQAHKAP